VTHILQKSRVISGGANYAFVLIKLNLVNLVAKNNALEKEKKSLIAELRSHKHIRIGERNSVMID